MEKMEFISGAGVCVYECGEESGLEAELGVRTEVMRRSRTELCVGGAHGGGAGRPEAGGSLGGGWGRLAPHMARGPQAYSPDFLAVGPWKFRALGLSFLFGETGAKPIHPAGRTRNLAKVQRGSASRPVPAGDRAGRPWAPAGPPLRQSPWTLTSRGPGPPPSVPRGHV